MREDNRLPIQIGRAVHTVRSERGETMREVAGRAGISQPMLSKVENGQIMPSITTLYGLAKALEVTVASLLPKVIGQTGTLTLRISDEEGSPKARLLSGGDHLEPQVYLITAKRGDRDHKKFTHPGIEFAFILSGTVTFHHGDETKRFTTGQHISYDATVPHWWEAEEDSEYLLIETS